MIVAPGFFPPGDTDKASDKTFLCREQRGLLISNTTWHSLASRTCPPELTTSGMALREAGCPTGCLPTLQWLNQPPLLKKTVDKSLLNEQWVTDCLH